MTAPRGIRNNNPGNIRRSQVKWQGQAAEQSDPDFVTFLAPEWGIRAIVRTLNSYQVYDGCKTIRQLISRWAPPNENDTTSYVENVSRACGVGPDDPTSVMRPSVAGPLVEAIIRQENGEQPYPADLISKALALAGVDPPTVPSARAQAA